MRNPKLFEEQVKLLTESRPKKQKIIKVSELRKEKPVVIKGKNRKSKGKKEKEKKADKDEIIDEN